jgi:hypothetical protein
MSAMSYVATLTWVTHRPQAQGRSSDWFESNRPSTAPAPTARLAAVFSLLPRRRGARRQPLLPVFALFGVSFGGARSLLRCARSTRNVKGENLIASTW